MAEIKKVIKNGTEYDVLNSDTVGSALTAGTGIGISSNTISNTGVTSVNGQTGAVTVDSGITKIFTLSSTSDLTNAQAAYEWWVNGGNPIIKYTTRYFILAYGPASTTSGNIFFTETEGSGAVSSGSRATTSRIQIVFSDSTVTAINYTLNYINISSSAPTSNSKNVITLVI